MTYTTRLITPVTNPIQELSVNLMLDDSWPEDVVRPVEIEIMRDTWTWIPSSGTLLGPLAFLKMPDKETTLCFEHLDEQGIRSGWHEFRGDWDFYAKGDDHAKRTAGNAFYEIFIASITAAARGIRVN